MSLKQSSSGPHCELRVPVDDESFSVSLDNAVATDMFVADPVSNAVKHADPEEAGDARLVLRAAEGDDLTLRVADDGVGVGVERAGRRQGSGLGSRTFGSPVRRLGSDLRYEGPGQGSCVVLDVSDAVAMPPDDAARRAP